MNKVLVMGGNGFIGKNIVNYLKAKGYFVSVYDIKDLGVGDINYAGNIIDDKNLGEIIANYDSIIYLISVVFPKKSMETPEAAYMQDIPLLLKVLESCVNNKVKQVIFSSSGGTIYGNSTNPKLSETDDNNPINHYGICKLACEKILLMYNKLYNMENIILRISNPYGMGQNPASGVGVITAFIDNIINNRPISLYGNGDISRDYIEVEKVAEAFELALNWNYDKEIIPVFNIGSGKSITLKELIDIISMELGIFPNINYLPERKFDVKANILDVSKSAGILGYTPAADEKEQIKKYVRNYIKKELKK